MFSEDVISRLPDVRPRVLKVLDLCCGKGGDLIKWLSADTQHLVSVDFAEKRLEECEKRFKDIMPRYLRDRPCKHEIILADCTRVSSLFLSLRFFKMIIVLSSV